MSALETVQLAPARTPSALGPLKVSELRVETVSDYQKFLDLKPAWDRLVDAAGIEHPFLEHDWIRTWWDCFGSGSALHIVLIHAGSDLIAIAPLILTTVRILGIRMRRLGFFSNEHVPRADFIISRHSEHVYRAIWNHLRREKCWDVLRLCQLTDDSETLDVLTTLASRDGCGWGLWISSSSPYIDLALRKPWRSYLDGLEQKFKANLRNRFNRLRDIQVVTATKPDAEQLQAVLDIEAAAWKGRAGTAILCNPSVRRFYTEFADRAGRRGWLRLNFLRTAGVPIACDYSLEYKKSIFVLKSGYDPAHAAFSPTNLLHCRAIEDAFARGLKRYDFLGDAAEWKMRWTKQTTQYFWLFVFPRTLKGELLYTLKFQLIPLLKRIRR